MTSPHSGEGYPRVKPGPGTSRLPEAETRLIPTFQPQFTFFQATIRSSKPGKAAFRSLPELPAPRPSLPRVHAACGRREQTAAAPEQSLERRSTPTQEREPWQRRGWGRGAGEGAGREGARAPLSLREFAGQGQAPPMPSAPPRSQQVALPPPHPVPVAGRRLLFTLLLRRPRTQAATRPWNRGENCQGERSAWRLPPSPTFLLNSENPTLRGGRSGRSRSWESSELGPPRAASAPGAGPAPAARTCPSSSPASSCTLPRLRLSLSLSRSSSESSGSDEEPVEESDEVERRRGCCRCDEPTAGRQPPSGSGGPGLAGGTSGSSAVTVSCGITGAGGARGSPLGTRPPRRLAPRARGSPAAAAAATAAQRASKSRRSSPTLRRGARSSPGLQGPAPPGRAMPVGPPGSVISRHESRRGAHQPAARRGLEALGAPGSRLPRGGACAAARPGPASAAPPAHSFRFQRKRGPPPAPARRGRLPAAPRVAGKPRPRARRPRTWPSRPLSARPLRDGRGRSAPGRYCLAWLWGWEGFLLAAQGP